MPLALRPGAEGVALRVVVLVAHQTGGFAVGAVDVAGVVQARAVTLGAPGHGVLHIRVAVAGPLEGAVGVFQVRAGVKHGRIGPVAVPAQDRDGVGHIQSALGVSLRTDVDKALHIEAVGIAQGLHVLYGLGGDLNLHLDLGGATGGNGDPASPV